ncbi:MAG TPA: PVC-type heme-binding CxxCH protein [Verrucomicrobiales bacterium]|nr:PVC-type heme-binding CxxCH protein [Verrucomicrobiales bacterium]
MKLCGVFLSAIAAAPTLAAAEFHIDDPRLEIALFAAAPDIVTPVGAACDARGRLFVIESHTHLARADYAGPGYDRVKVFTDADDDGRAERIEIFAEGFEAAMGCAFAPDGALYVVCAGEVWRLEDGDDDCRAEQRTKVLTLETEETYPHNKLLSAAFGPDGRLYVGRGNTGGHAWTLRGAGGASAGGYGDGGSIARCWPDGAQLEEFATGFWNPFGLEFDSAGRLIAVDNDPDARGPNRLVHVVHGGNYGHTHLYGGAGNHPFQAWDGELPGTLPYLSGTGEAPCAVLDASRAALPADFAGALLVTVWSEHTIERHSTRPRGASVAAERSVLVRGPQDFRPVALAPDPRGNLYITDWVKVDYPNHGQGRIWRLRTKPAVAVVKPRSIGAPPESNSGNRALETHFAAGWEELPQLEQALRGDDPFLRHAAVMSLAQTKLLPDARRLAESSDSRLRLGALLALRRSAALDRETLARPFLGDADPEVRLAALHWTADETLEGLRADLDRAIVARPPPKLFQAWLAAIACLDADYVRALRQREPRSARQLTRRLPAEFIERLLGDAARPARLRALAVSRLENPGSNSNRALLARSAHSDEPALQIEAIRSLAHHGGDETPPLLAALALDTSQAAWVRAEALTALESLPAAGPLALAPLLDDPHPAVATACAALLGRFAGDGKVTTILRAKRDRLSADAPSALREALDAALDEVANRPGALDEWQRALAAGGDALSGERVFFSARASCGACHAHQGRGGQNGPDLSGLGQSATREKIIHSILRPSDEFAPQWQAWIIETKGGDLHQGLQLHPKSGGAYDLFTLAGRFERFAGEDIAGVRAATASLMPEGLEAALTVSELRDLVAFLASR